MNNTEELRELKKQRRVRHDISQALIDDILSKELKDFTFSVHPVYNRKLRDANGITRFQKSGTVTSIEIGKQDKPERKFLVDTLLHEYYEAEIVSKQHTDSVYAKLNKANDIARHKWIRGKIDEFFDRMEDEI